MSFNKVKNVLIISNAWVFKSAIAKTFQLLNAIWIFLQNPTSKLQMKFLLYFQHSPSLCSRKASAAESFLRAISDIVISRCFIYLERCQQRVVLLWMFHGILHHERAEIGAHESWGMWTGKTFNSSSFKLLVNLSTDSSEELSWPKLNKQRQFHLIAPLLRNSINQNYSNYDYQLP